MKTIEYKKRHSLKHRRKVISINENNEDQECKTHVHKSFVYVVAEILKMGEVLPAPQIYIRKKFNSKSQEESFSFKVKGAFYMNRGRSVFKVHFCHALRIQIVWKYKIFSPEKSATLT
jgi:hypothetical protein